MRLRRLVSLLLLLTTLSGCWSRRELTDASFVGGLGIDWADGRYEVTLQILQPRGQQAEQGGMTTRGGWTISEQAPAIGGALAKLDQVLERPLTLEHVRVVVFGREAAERGIGPAIDFLLRTIALRPTAWVAVSSGRAFDLFLARPRQEPMPTDGPLGYEDTAARRTSLTPARRLVQVANILQEEGVSLTLPLFRLGSDDLPKPEAVQELGMQPRPGLEREIFYGGAGVFRNDKLVAWLTPEETRGHLWGIGQVFRGAVSAECPGPKESQRILFRLRKSTNESRAYLRNGQVVGSVRVKVVADVDEITCNEDVVRPGDASLLEKALADRVRETITLALEVSRSTGSDIFGFGQSLFRSAPSEFRAREQQWSELVRKMPVAVQVEARVPRIGQLNQRYRLRRER